MVVGKNQKYVVGFTHVFLWAFIIAVFFPIIYIFAISFQSGQEMAIKTLIPENLSLEHWRLALGIEYIGEHGELIKPDFPVPLWIWNSVKVSSIASALVVLLSTTCAYAFARLKFRYKPVILNSLLILQMLPMVLALVAIYTILDFLGGYVSWLGLDTHGGLILVYLGGISLNIWMIKAYFENIPASMEESAMMDGATSFQAFIHILLPMSYPILSVAFILSFIANFGEYPVARVIMQQEENMTLAVGLLFFLQEQRFLWGDFAAAAILGGFPITVMFLFTQKFLVSGLTAGSEE